MTHLIHAVALALFANISIYVGIAFVNAQLLPSMMGGFYDSSTVWVRILIMSVVTAPLANYLFSVVYQKAGANYAGMMIIGTLALVLVSKAMLLSGTGLSMRLFAAMVALMVAALWMAYELAKAHH